MINILLIFWNTFNYLSLAYVYNDMSDKNYNNFTTIFIKM